ncbi:MAG TPA: two-component regulator propeller domain-containing protein [Bryobacteraceae bacterium]|nr:two-component regulator propeller domain-containing protein [Bryobacteraceae bacterium]
MWWGTHASARLACRKIASGSALVALAPAFVMAVLMFAAATPLAAALDPSKALTQYIQDVWSTESGLPHSSVTAIAQTPDGYLWLGTEEGLARFDGVRFTTFDTHNTPSLNTNQISALLVDSKRRLWIGTEGGGLTLLSGGRFTTYSSNGGLSNDAILSLYEDQKGVLWIGTDGGGLRCFHNGSFSRCGVQSVLRRGAIFSIAGAADGSLWLGTHDGLAHLAKGIAELYTQKDGLPDDYIKSVYIDRSGGVWAGTNGGGLSHFVNGRFVNYTIRDGLASNAIWSIYEDTDRTLWIATIDGGLSRFRDGKFSNYAEKDGLPFNRVFSFFEDREGDFWIGTGGAGLVRLKSGVFTSVTRREGLSDDVVLPVFEDRQGAIWLGTNGRGLDRLKDGQITNYSTRNGLLDNLVFSLAEDREGSLWIATRRGLDRLKNGKFTVFNANSGLPSDIVLCLYEDRQGVLWAGSRGGLSRLDGTHFKTYTIADGLTNDYVTSIQEDHYGALWIGTGGGGLNKLQSGHFSVYSTKQGLSSDTIRALSEDTDGTLWIGTSGGGLDRLKDGKVTVYTTRTGLFDDELFQILPDRYGYLWMSSNKGIFRVAKQQLEAFAQGRIASIVSTVYGQSDGLKSRECNGGFQPAGWRTRDGRLLFPTMKGGLAIVDPGKLKSNDAPPNVVVERASVDGIDFGPGRPFRAKPGKGRLEFEFTALSLVAPEKIRFKYKLEGFDKDWIDAGTRRAAYYTNIAPGDYRFTVIACNNDGVWNYSGDSLPFSLAPHFYQTPLFIAGCIALLTALSLAAYRLRVNQLIANEKKLVCLVNERTQSLREEVQAKERARAELAQAQQHLMELSRRSGMAEVATGVLHNVGNVLNSVNVGASVISDKLRKTRLDNLAAAVKLVEEHAQDFPEFVQSDPKGQRLLPYLLKLASHLQSERGQVLTEVEALITHVDHIKKIVSTQQDYAKTSALLEVVLLPELVDDAFRMVDASFHRHHVRFQAEYDDVPSVWATRHKILDILVNLLSNAKQSVIEQNGPQRLVRVSVVRQGNDHVRVVVRDTGVGLPKENLTRIFAHGFTTKPDGHGFGLHSGALAAQQMGGSLWAESEGVGYGATFTLELPVVTAKAEPQNAAHVEMNAA